MNDLKNAIFNLYKETELLNQSFKSNKLNYFAKHSQAREFLSQLGKKNQVLWFVHNIFRFIFRLKKLKNS